MAKFIIVVPPFYGHINPTLGLGAELVNRGHHVTWFCAQEFPKISIPETSAWHVPDSLQSDPAIKKLLAVPQQIHFSVIESLKLLYEDMAIPLCELMMEPLESFIKSFNPDVIISDQLAFAGSAVAYKHNIPYATSWSVPSGIPDITPLPKLKAWTNTILMSLQQKIGLDTNELVLFSKEINLVVTSKEFMMQDIPAPYQMVGPLILGRSEKVPFDWDRLNASKFPKVLISIGTVHTNLQKDFFEKAIAAFRDLEVTIVAVANPEILDHWPDNFIVQGYIPQLEVLEHVDILIGHGGHNTTCEALSRGLPAIITPITNDQYDVADQIEKTGCGLRANFYRLKSEMLKEMLLDLINDPKYKENSERIRNSFEIAGGISKAVSLVEGLIPAAAQNVIYI